jgi:hypothetical protein
VSGAKFVPSAFYSHNCAYLYFFDNTIAHWSKPVRHSLRNLQMRGAFIAAIASEKLEMIIKKFMPPMAIDNKFFIAYLPILVRCKTKGAVRAS